MSLSVERIAAGAGIIGSNVVAWAQSAEVGNWGIGGIVTGITALSAALCTAVVFGLRQIGPAYVDFRRQIDEAHKASLSGQLDELSEQLGHARASLHAIRNEYAAERIRHQSEADRLIDITQALHATIDRQTTELSHQADEIAKLRSEIDRLNARIAELTDSTNRLSGDNLPATRGTTPRRPQS